MKFRRVEPNGTYSSLRMSSEQGVWEFGLSVGSSGTRLRMGRAGRPPRVLDFCMGQDANCYASVTLAVLAKLDRLPEESNEEEIDGLFPWAGTRPDLAIHLEALLKQKSPGFGIKVMKTSSCT